ncbi:MAG TPA: hypothetical protein VHO90_17440 [Bacteroidales bacterium]|nr:hypothetical protein [Bacteroidales bacterium]
MRFFITPEFAEALSLIVKKKKDGYTTCPLDISNELKNKTADELWNTLPVLVNGSYTRTIKARVANSGLNMGQSSGFRLIYTIHKEKEEIILMYIFPKTGRLGRLNISADELKDIYKKMISYKLSNELIEVDIRKFYLNF